jgi:G3E family GTPase
LPSFFNRSPSHDAKDGGFVSFSFEHEACFHEECFQSFLKGLPFEVFRVKGLVRFPGHTRILNFVGGKAEWQDRGENSPTRLAIIGWNIEPEMYIRMMEACLQQ